MKRNLLLTIYAVISAFSLQAQVTQINSNKSLHVKILLNSNTAIAASDIDSSIWVSDGNLSGTVQISSGIKYESYGALLSGKFIFRGSTPATGSEIYITDGTPGGTTLVKDIYSGAASSAPGDFASLGGYVYFSATTAAEGRELWRTDGTSVGTTLVKDIVPGTDSSNRINQYHLFSTGTYLLFAARTAATGVELWKSDGTNSGTVLLKDINTGNSGADSSNPNHFYAYKNLVLFTATDATHGNEIWETDGTTGGTILLKDINPGVASSTSFEVFPGVFAPVFLGFHTFNGNAFFNANDGTSTGEVWVTDGTPGNTTLLKDIVSGTSYSTIFLINAVNLSSKFIFAVSDNTSRSELWQSDGTPGGTVLFKSFSPITPGSIPIIFLPYNAGFITGPFSQPLFQGNKFFFAAGTSTEGYELWVSDGTLVGTNMVKDINPGTGNGIDISNNLSYLYTSTTLFFAANDGTNGNELWKTDGTNVGTVLS